jgi:hypothetical protein
MAFDYRKFERCALFGTLAALDCSREVLRHAASRYGIASAQPGEKRKALRESGITLKQLDAQIKSARSLRGFLGRIQHDARLVAANQIPHQSVLLWIKDLEDAENFLRLLTPFRPDAKDGALALALHVEKKTGRRHLPEIAKLLNAALSAAGLPDSLTVETLQKQLTRANRKRAQALLDGWESLPPAKKRNR